jgi:hypothetical protein
MYYHTDVPICVWISVVICNGVCLDWIRSHDIRAWVLCMMIHTVVVALHTSYMSQCYDILQFKVISYCISHTESKRCANTLSERPLEEWRHDVLQNKIQRSACQGRDSGGREPEPVMNDPVAEYESTSSSVGDSDWSQWKFNFRITRGICCLACCSPSPPSSPLPLQTIGVYTESWWCNWMKSRVVGYMLCFSLPLYNSVLTYFLY